MIDILDRVRNKGLQAKIVTAEEAAAFIQPGMNVATSGFTASAYPKAVPMALAERMKKDPFTINLWTGASTGPELDDVLAGVHGIKQRLPYQTDKMLRNEINDGSVNYLDLHLSESAQLSRCGYLGHIDVAIVEACAIDEDGTHAAAGQRVYRHLLLHPAPHRGQLEGGMVNQVLSQRLVVDQGQKILCAHLT